MAFTARGATQAVMVCVSICVREDERVCVRVCVTF